MIFLKDLIVFYIKLPIYFKFNTLPPLASLLSQNINSGYLTENEIATS